MRLWLVIALLLVASSASATTVVAMSTEQVFDKAATSLLGEVVELKAGETSDGRIFTEVRLKVDECFFSSEIAKLGESYVLQDGTYTFRHWGGELGDRKLLIHGSPVFQVGEKVLVALENNPTGEARFCVGLGQGKYRIEGDRAVRDMRGLQLLKPDGRIEEAEDDSRPVAELLDFVRAHYKDR